MFILECKLFMQGIDMMFLEMRLCMEFHPTLLTTLVQQSWEEAAFDEVYNEWVEELDEPREEVVPREVAPTGANEGGEEDGVPGEEVVFPVPGGEEEESEVPGEGFVVPGEEVGLVQEVQILPRKRRRGRSEAEALRSDLGRYWEGASSNGGAVCRRSCRARRPPVRYTP